MQGMHVMKQYYCVLEHPSEPESRVQRVNASVEASLSWWDPGLYVTTPHRHWRYCVGILLLHCKEKGGGVTESVPAVFNFYALHTILHN